MNGVIQIFELPHVQIDMREACRYLGYGAQEPTGQVRALLQEAEQTVLCQARFRACYASVDLHDDGTTLDAGFAHVSSVALRRNLCGCAQAYVLCATLGVQIDRCIATQAAIAPSRALVLDAVATAAIESFCDALCAMLEQKTCEKLRPRFSPGYGDLPLAVQEQLVRYLDAPRKVGVTLTRTLQMTPRKSVTAIAGIGGVSAMQTSGCRACDKRDCPFRKVEEK
jgi:hypothetical protein